MNPELFELIYTKLNGELEEDTILADLIPFVPNLFEPGSECEEIRENIFLYKNLILSSSNDKKIDYMESLFDEWEKLNKTMIRTVISLRAYSNPLFIADLH